MKQLIPAILIVALAGAALAAPPEITNVRAEQRDGTKLVDIWYDAADADGDLLKIRIEVSDNDGARYSVPAFSLTGDIGEGIAPGANKHIVWDAGTDWDGEYSDKMRVKVFAIDAKGYPGLEWGDEVPPGGFLLGQDGGAEGSGPSRHVNIPWSYWLSKYEITVGQYCDFLNTALAVGRIRRDGQVVVYSVAGTNLIENMNDSYPLVTIGDDRDIRWNVNNFEVVGSYTNHPVRVTWYGAMAFAHFYGYDLPTEAEWEKAARGPDYDDQDEHQLYAWGNTLSAAYGRVGVGWGSGNQTMPVGFYNGNQTPIGPNTKNGYGLYDMTGNVAEWTLTSGAYGIATYPQQESIINPRHQYWLEKRAFCCKGGGLYDLDPAIFKRGILSPDEERVYNDESLSGLYYQADEWKRHGFRIARRNGIGIERPKAAPEIFEDFETWPTKTTSGGQVVSVASGIWEMTGWSFLKDDSSNAFSGNKYKSYYNEDNDGQLFLPPLTNQLLWVRMKARNICRNQHSVSLFAHDPGGSYYGVSVNVPANSDYSTISLTPPRDADNYYITAPGVDIDDLEIWTRPRAAGE